MPGPQGKNASVRARRNKTTTAAKLKVDETVVAPVLPELDWHPSTLEWWEDVWASPMAPEYDGSDEHGLIMLAILVNDFWTAKSSTGRIEAMKEIRLQSQRFGLSPMDRRRLQWEIERTDAAQDAGAKRRERTAAPKTPPADDPRNGLYAV